MHSTVPVHLVCCLASIVVGLVDSDVTLAAICQETFSVIKLTGHFAKRNGLCENSGRPTCT